MRNLGWKLMLVAAATVAGGSGLAASAAADAGFSFSPQPRWDKDPDASELCAVVAKECPRMIKRGQIEAEVGFDEIYDARGMLVGMRLTKSTGCKALDEESLVSHRDFRLAFHKDDAPDLDATHAEVAARTDPAAVRIVKADGTSISVECN